MGKAVLIENLSVAYPRKTGGTVRVLEHIDLRIDAGEFVSVLGPSGCGKSTLLNTVAGFVRPLTGRVTVGATVVAGPGPDRGMVFQEYGLFPWFTVAQNIEIGPRLRGIPPEECRRISRHYIELVGLKGFEHHYPRELSGGMKQRVGIARALANKPEVLLLDEPFGALDALTREQMQEELLRTWEREGVTCIFVTHSVSEAIFLSDRVIVMAKNPGRIVKDVAVEAPRMRNRTAPAFVALQEEITRLVKNA